MNHDGASPRRSSQSENRSSAWLTVVGIGDDGWEGLSARARAAVEAAEVVAGGDRHLAMLPNPPQQAITWVGTFSEALAAVLRHRGRRVVVLASGDPLHYGVGSLIARQVPAIEVTFIPAVSSMALARAAMGWSDIDTAIVTACSKPLASLAAELYDGARIILLCADRTTPAAAAQLLVDRGYGRSSMTVLEHLGGAAERRATLVASAFPAAVDLADLNLVAIAVVAGQPGAGWSRLAGLADDAYEHDGQITKREVRALTLAALGPRPGELLWDVGAGSGSIGIEWLRGVPRARAIGIEADPVRAARARANAERLGVPALTIVEGRAPAALVELPPPDAIFVGGGFSEPTMLDLCWQRLKPGGRLVVNAVTLETEAVLLAAYARLGGTLTRLSIDRADPVGRLTGWRPAMPVTQWAVTKPGPEAAA